MTNRSINRHLKAFAQARAEWIEVLSKNAGNTNACLKIIEINAKMDAYRLMWNWSDESIEMDAHHYN